MTRLRSIAAASFLVSSLLLMVPWDSAMAAVPITECRLRKLETVDGVLYRPKDICLVGNAVFVADMGNNRIVEFTTDGTMTREFGAAGSSLGEFVSPQSVTVTTDGRLIVADVGNKRVCSVNLKDGSHSLYESGFYVFDVTADGQSVLYTGTRAQREPLLLYRDSGGVQSGIGEPFPITHEYDSVFRNANTVVVDKDGPTIVVGSPALAVIRVLSEAGDVISEFFLGGDELNYVRHEAWHKMLKGPTEEVFLNRRSISKATREDVEDDLAALAQPKRFGFPSYISDLKLWNNRIFVLVGERLLEYSIDGELLARYTFLSDENKHIYIFAFDFDNSGRFWGVDSKHTFGIYFVDTAEWREN